MTTKSLFILIFILNLPFRAHSQIYNGENQSQIELNSIIEQIQSGTILVVGEVHGKISIHDQQLSILSGLRAKGLKVSVGMEFFNYTDQDVIQKFRNHEISEETFKQSIGWSGFDFSLYGPQLTFGEYGLGLNIPRSVTGVISKNGLAALNPDQLKLMPPEFELGNDAYKKRFFEAMGGHGSQVQLNNYFAAQSTWDETMAWQTLEFMKNHQDQVFVIIVGEFHVQYGGGLPDRLRARIHKLNLPLTVKTISQVWTEGLTAAEIENEIKPSLDYGPRANFIFLAN